MQRNPHIALSPLTVLTVAVCCALPVLALAERTQAPPANPPPAHTPQPHPAICNLHAGEVFDGRYLCAQGQTAMRLQVLEVRGRAVRAAFDFNWAQGGVTGRFTLRGTCDGATHIWAMQPEAWERQPPGWIMVGMDGALSSDGAAYSGRMTYRDCGDFSVTRL